ncbi:hypothetical protein FRC09_015407, partial [Ceratobasidium sp. 395]
MFGLDKRVGRLGLVRHRRELDASRGGMNIAPYSDLFLPDKLASHPHCIRPDPDYSPMPRPLHSSPRPTQTLQHPRVEQPVVTAPPRLVPLELAQAELQRQRQLEQDESQQGSSRDITDPVRRTRKRRAQKLEERQQ